ncbi:MULTISPECIES: hypothetical protein [Brucella]|uniref:Uncharacterized protein n=1 Tax=Brucella lupini TaxID=255457 RepID=A0A256GID6_9HYPH|nr:MULTISPECIES: hypothetical protein [Brucella]KAB2705050.1 hypothetical protein F9L03_06580 [Brucella lupini]KAB2736054.1 hypothetical protein F9K89_15865 [Brucella anthropi]OYR26905.1 hypothetical protein CES86_3257 [Brucella lupini]
MSDKPKQEEQKTERFNMFMSPSEMKAIDDWAWENKIRSKSEAVRRLCQIGIAADEHFIPMANGYVDVFNAALEVAEQTDNEADAIKIFDSVSKIAEAFTRMRGAILSMKGNEEIEKSLIEIEEYRNACDTQNLSPTQAMLSLWKSNKRKSEK